MSKQLYDIKKMGQSLTTQGYGAQVSYIVVNGLVGPDGNRKKFKTTKRYQGNDIEVLQHEISKWALYAMFEIINNHIRNPGKHIHIHIDTNHSVIDIENVNWLVNYVFDYYNSGKVEISPSTSHDRIEIPPVKIIIDHNFIGFDDEKSRNNKIIADSLVTAIPLYASKYGYQITAKSSKAAEVGYFTWFGENE